MLKRVMLVACGMAVSFVATAFAQDANFGRSVWLNQANCADCHGWLGDGNAADPRSPRGANLRETQMDADQLAEVILCGRPGTGMPYFDSKAYTDKRCYGSSRADFGDLTPQQAQTALTKRHADGLAQFILAVFAGKGEATREQCVALLGIDSKRCGDLRN